MKRFPTPQKDPRQTLKIILIAGAMMILINHFAGEWLWPGAQDISQPQSHMQDIERSEVQDFKKAKAALEGIRKPEGLSDTAFLSLPQPEPILNKPPVHDSPDAPLQVQPEIPPPENGGGARIVIIIDDMGMDRQRSHAVIALDAPLTLAFLPYAPALPDITAEASKAGHELMIHMPMEPLSKTIDPGPLAMRSDMSPPEIHDILKQALSSFDGYVGINNHMGSKLTQNAAVMRAVMADLAAQDLLFVDSKTIHNSIAANIASEHGVRFAERDVFLDHEDSYEFVRASLARLEAIARMRGFAVAIGHPKDATIKALREWIPEVRKRGYKIVPVSEVVKREKRTALSTEALLAPGQ